MHFFVTLNLDQLSGSPAELQSAITEFVENELQAGSFAITRGLASHSDGVRVSYPPTACPRATHVCRSTASQLSRRPRCSRQSRLHPAC